jgi:hypothetical protein
MEDTMTECEHVDEDRERAEAFEALAHPVAGESETVEGGPARIERVGFSRSHGASDD